MYLSKAIEIIDLNIRQRSPKMPPDVLAALKLLNEGGKAILKMRHYPFPDEILLLPGEDPE